MWPLRCSALDDAQLVLGIDAGEHAHVLDDGVELGVAHGAQLGAGDDPRAGLEDVELARDRLGGRRMVAGDHHGADMRAPGGRDRGLRLGARRVDHADEAEQHEVVLDRCPAARRRAAASRGLRIEAERGGRQRAGRDRERAQRLRGERVVAPGQLGALGVAERDDLAVLPQVAAVREQDLGRALHEHAQLARMVAVAMDRGVALALGGEGDLGDAREARELGFGDAELACRDDQRAFGRVALHAPAALAVGERGVVGERGGAQDHCDATSRTGDAGGSGDAVAA